MKRILKLHFGIGAIAALLFVSIAVFVAMAMRSMMVDEARKTAEGVVQTAVANIDTLITGVESAVNNSAWIVGERLDEPDFMFKATRGIVEHSPFIYGSTMAYRPGYLKNRPYYFAPYSFVTTNGVIKSFPLGDDYKYPEWSWYSEPVRLGHSTWSEPFFDEGGGDIMMSTYSVPIRDASGDIVAVLTADVSLADLTEHIAKVRPYVNSYATLHTKGGKELVPPPPNVQNAERQNAQTVTISGTARNGWTVELTTPLVEILRSAQRVVIYIGVFSLLGLGLILTVSWVFTNRLQRQAAAHQRVESELAIANAIQTSMVCVKFPDWAAARMRPAKEVGGDRYDFSERDGIVWFGIGDASGKSVPAALYTSLVGAGFRMGVEAGLEPAAIVGAVNRIIAEHNDNGMFVTAFLGRVDRASGRFDFCNAGHNPPLVIAPDGTVRLLEVKRNIVMGALDQFAYAEQSVTLAPGSKLLLYTDGVTEAMTRDNEQYGVPRLLAFAERHAKDAPREMVDALMKSVGAFANGAPQSDDITILVLDC